ncbi:MAG TPA: hypothetical protein GXX42_05120, partial [Petrimonas sp.]|uniref:hypothetical protein n=2 Tax=Petrimonas sp. TaxID=2023866 RepID=UPI00176178EA|nr:hypothetical protein [Petrimonas sp.]
MKKVLILLGFCLLFSLQADAQKWLNKLGNTAKEAAKSTMERRVEQKTEEVTEGTPNEAESTVIKEETEAEEKEETGLKESKEEAKEPPQKLVSAGKYDFVPGDKILYFEDFSQDAIGDFPALWTTNGSGEVKTVNIAPGKWFHMNGEDAVYCYTRQIDFPDNFIVE